MKLFYSQTSPYARKCRMMLRQQGVRINVQEILTDPFNDEEYRSVNPLGKVPALIDEDLTLFDSPLICEYLDSKRIEKGGESLFKRNGANYFSAQVTHTQADGIIDAAVSSVMEQRRDTEHSHYWLNRWKRSIEASIECIDTSKLGNAENPHIGTLATASALAYLDFRLSEQPWREWNPSLETWYTRISDQTWMSDTQP